MFALGLIVWLVKRWGIANVRIDPELTKRVPYSGQGVAYSVLLVDRGCIETLMVMN